MSPSHLSARCTGRAQLRSAPVTANVRRLLRVDSGDQGASAFGQKRTLPRKQASGLKSIELEQKSWLGHRTLQVIPITTFRKRVLLNKMATPSENFLGDRMTNEQT